MVLLAVKVAVVSVVDGANQTLPPTSFAALIVIPDPPFLLTAAVNTSFWLIGAVLSTVKLAVEALETLRAASITNSW